MKYLNVLQLVVIVSLIGVFSSCKKDNNNDNTPSVESQLVGKWTGDEYYEDGVLSDFNSFFQLGSIEFKADGTGTSTSFLGAQPFTWSYDAATEKLSMQMQAVDLGGGLSIDASVIEGAEITKIDASSLWYTYKSDSLTVEEHYKK